MKHILTLLSFFLPFISFSQNVTLQSVPNTVVNYRGGLGADSVLGIPIFPDTSKANVYPHTNYRKRGNIIYTTDVRAFWVNDGNLWMRLADTDTLQSMLDSSQMYRYLRYGWDGYPCGMDYQKDGIGVVVLDSFMYYIGGWNPTKVPTTDSQVYVTKPDMSITKLSDAPFKGRHSFGFGSSNDTGFVWDGDINQGIYQKDAWMFKVSNPTTGAVTWTQQNKVVPYPDRILAGHVVCNNYLFTIGGQYSGNPNDPLYGDVWRRPTHDTTWVQVASGLTQFGMNLSGCVAYYNGYIYVIGGGVYGTANNSLRMYRSADNGTTWQRRKDIPFVGRQYPSIEVLDGYLYYGFGHNIGQSYSNSGNLNDLYRMDTSENWTQIFSGKIPLRHASTMAAFDSTLTLVGGNFDDSSRYKSTFEFVTYASKSPDSFRVGSLPVGSQDTSISEVFLSIKNNPTKQYGQLGIATIRAEITPVPKSVARRDGNGYLEAVLFKGTDGGVINGTMRGVLGYNNSPGDNYYYMWDKVSLNNFWGHNDKDTFGGDKMFTGDTVFMKRLRVGAITSTILGNSPYNGSSFGAYGSGWMYAPTFNPEFNFFSGQSGTGLDGGVINTFLENTNDSMVQAAYISMGSGTVSNSNYVSGRLNLGVRNHLGNLMDVVSITDRGLVGLGTSAPIAALSNTTTTDGISGTTDGIAFRSVLNDWAMVFIASPPSGPGYAFRSHTRAETSNDYIMAASSGIGTGTLKFSIRGNGDGYLSGNLFGSGNVEGTVLKSNTPNTGAATDLRVVWNSTDKEFKTLSNPYRIYTFLLHIDALGDPSTADLQNTLIGTPTITHTSTGLYNVALVGGFTTNVWSTSITYQGYIFNITKSSADLCQISVTDLTGTPADPINVDNIPLEIRVY